MFGWKRFAALAVIGLLALDGSVTAVAAADIERGRTIAERWCAACHLVAPEQVRASDAVPTFEAIARRRELTPDNLATFLAAPHPVMPNLDLSRDQIADLVAYVESLAR